MTLTKFFNILGASLALAAIAVPASADVLFDVGSDGLIFFGAGRASGTGQPVDILSDLTLKSFAVDFYLPTGGNAEFMIWDGSDTQLLYSEIDPVSASSSGAYHSTRPINLKLSAGNIYYFGVMANAELQLGVFYAGTFRPPVATPGVDLIPGDMSVYESNDYFGLSNPFMPSWALGAKSGPGYVGLELLGSYDLTSVPEPLSLFLFGAGLAGAVALRRRESV